ncbi:MAG: sigma-70 family RNA polymerase sigma factor [Anaerolineales bacterium]
MSCSVASESELLQRAQTFDRQALAEIYDLYSPGLYRYALRLLGDASAAEDCLAETFSRFLQALRRGKGPRNYLQAYLYRVAHNWITDQYRRQPPPAAELDERFPDLAAAPEEIVARRSHRERLRRALQRLTPEQRQVIALKYLEGWQNEQIARALGKPVGAVKSLQHRALTRLQRLLANEELR